MHTSFNSRHIFTILFTSLLFVWVGNLKARQKELPEFSNSETYKLALPKLIPYRQAKLWGYADSTGVIRIKPQFDFVEPFKGEYAIVKKGDFVNLINLQGELQLKWQFRSLSFGKEGLVFAETPERLMGLYKPNGQELLSPIYKSVSYLKGRSTNSPALIQVWQEVKPETNASGVSSSAPSQKMGVLSEGGKWVLPMEFGNLMYLGGGIISANKDGKFIYYSEKGDLLPAYNDYHLQPFHNGLSHIFRDKVHGFIDSTGHFTIPLQFDDATYFSEGVAAVAKNKKWAYLDKTGKLLTPFKYDQAGAFIGGYATVRIGSYYGLVDLTGKEITEIKYLNIYADKPGELFRFNENDVTRYGFRGKGSTTIIIPEDLTEINQFNEGLAVATKNGKKGYIDETGKEVIPFKYTEAERVVSGLASVHNGQSWGVINTKNEIVIPFVFDGLWVINPDRFIVLMFNRPAWGLIALMNSRLQEIIPLKYTYITPIDKNRLYIGTPKGYGISDLNGQLIMKPIVIPEGYETNESLQQGILKVQNKKTEQLGYIDFKGRLYFQD